MNGKNSPSRKSRCRLPRMVCSCCCLACRICNRRRCSSRSDSRYRGVAPGSQEAVARVAGGNGVPSEVDLGYRCVTAQPVIPLRLPFSQNRHCTTTGTILDCGEATAMFSRMLIFSGSR
jgi:hypothetical protein